MKMSQHRFSLNRDGDFSTCISMMYSCVGIILDMVKCLCQDFIMCHI